MKRGEVWEVNLDPSVGAEINKTRPAVIVSHDSIGRLPLKIVVPITEWDPNFARAAWHIPIDAINQKGLIKKSSADTFQVRSVSQKRLVSKLGELTQEDMIGIEQGLIISLGLSQRIDLE